MKSGERLSAFFGEREMQGTLWLSLNAADWHLTTLLLQRGHGEGNPVVAHLVGGLSPEAFLGYKLLLALAVLVGLSKWGRKGGVPVLKMLNVAMVGVVLWNAVWLLL